MLAVCVAAVEGVGDGVVVVDPNLEVQLTAWMCSGLRREAEVGTCKRVGAVDIHRISLPDVFSAERNMPLATASPVRNRELSARATLLCAWCVFQASKRVPFFGFYLNIVLPLGSHVSARAVAYPSQSSHYLSSLLPLARASNRTRKKLSHMRNSTLLARSMPPAIMMIRPQHVPPPPAPTQ